VSATLQPLQHATRQQVFTALFSFLQGLPPPPGSSSWGLMTQQVLEPSEVPVANQPALILCRGPQNITQKAPGVSKLHWRCFFLIYFQTDNFKTSNSKYPDQFTDPVLDSIEQLFQPPMNDQYLTLGGVVQNVWIDGMIASDPGIVDSQAFILVPLSIMV